MLIAIVDYYPLFLKGSFDGLRENGNDDIWLYTI